MGFSPIDSAKAINESYQSNHELKLVAMMLFSPSFPSSELGEENIATRFSAWADDLDFLDGL